MELFPIFLKLQGRPCLVVGAGAVAEAKIQTLLRAGAEVRVVAPRATPAIRALAAAKKIRWEARGFHRRDLERIFLVVAATSSPKLHEMIFQQANRCGALCNVVDDPVRCDFYYPAIVRRGSLQIAISTNGQSPALAQRLRKELEQEFGPEYEEWINVLGKARKELLGQRMQRQRRVRALHRLASPQAFRAFVRQSRAAQHGISDEG